MIRTFDHTVDAEYLRGIMAGPWSAGFNQVRERVAGRPSAEYSLTVAVDTFYEGVCLGWAFANDEALTQFRQLLSNHVADTLDRFEVDEIRDHSSHRTFSRAGAGLEPAVIVRYAEVLRDRQRYMIVDAEAKLDPHRYADALLDGLMGLVLGELGVAQKMSIVLNEHLEHPRTPPKVTLWGLGHAIDAVARQDQAALDDAVDYVAERHAHDATPMRDQPAGPASLVHPYLNLICRVATWYGMSWPGSPTTPYIMTIADHIAHDRLRPV